MGYSDLEERTFNFSVKTIRFLRTLSYSREIDVIKHQLAKSSTSIGANYEESQGAFSKEDFRYKIGICFREAKETNYWFRILAAIDADKKTELDYLIQESCELKNIFGSIYKKVHKRAHKAKGPSL
ncbi:MAG: four helix bundle protein [Candidatus Tantalella remota]|nr:four helix bundle protein [Candidatus Tantalella remota]